MTRIPAFEDYAFDIAPLSTDDGGGFLITWPDLPGCMSDGDTVEEAIVNGHDAFKVWMQVYAEERREIPIPGTGGTSGKFVQRLPKSFHARLAACAKAEGVSMNTLVATMLAENLGLRESRHQ
jgi:antitoxin HicB